MCFFVSFCFALVLLFVAVAVGLADWLVDWLVFCLFCFASFCFLDLVCWFGWLGGWLVGWYLLSKTAISPLESVISLRSRIRNFD